MKTLDVTPGEMCAPGVPRDAPLSRIIPESPREKESSVQVEGGETEAEAQPDREESQLTKYPCQTRQYRTIP